MPPWARFSPPGSALSRAIGLFLGRVGSGLLDDLIAGANRVPEGTDDSDLLGLTVAESDVEVMVEIRPIRHFSGFGGDNAFPRLTLAYPPRPEHMVAPFRCGSWKAKETPSRGHPPRAGSYGCDFRLRAGVGRYRSRRPARRPGHGRGRQACAPR